MYSLFKKEIISFLGSLIGYLAVAVFLLVTGLFLWVLPGNYNIPDSGYASMEGLFSLAPWLYLFLVPAITMRFFAEEKKSGTLEVLLTRPISDMKLVLAKFFAGLVLVIFSLVPTLLTFYSVYWLGNPVGSLDMGAAWGAYIGLCFLAAIYVAIGVFASALTDNQIVSFIVAMLLSFIFYLGFEFAASAGVTYSAERFLTWLSINEHYLSVSRGVIDMRDIIYFAGMAALFLLATVLFIRRNKWKERKIRLKSAITLFGFAIVFVISSNFFFRYDLTSDKRYTLSGISIDQVKQLEKPVEMELYLVGELEPGLRKIQNEIIEKIAVLNAYAEKPIRIRITDPYRIGNKEKQEAFLTELARKGVSRISFRRKTEKGMATKYIFPGALMRYGNRETAINFLKNNPAFSYEMNFNHSVETIEYELVNAMRKLMRQEKKMVAFLTGHGEASQYEISDLARQLSTDYRVEMITAEQLEKEDVEVLVIANPVEKFDEISKFIIDQYLMKGGKIIWAIDPVEVSLDSLRSGMTTYSFPRDLNLSDQLFRYGVRLNYELLQDVNCRLIEVNTAAPDNPQKLTRHPWYYSPLLTPNDNHPVSRNLNWVLSEFVSSVDTLPGGKVFKEVILSTSPNSRRVKAPSSVSLRNIDNPPARELFSEAHIPVGVLLEGEFTSVYKNRMVEHLGIPGGREVIGDGKPTRMVVIADGGALSNKVNYSSDPPRIMKLGYDMVLQQTFGNMEFFVNVIDYLSDNQGIMHLRGRTLKLRLLDKVRLREEKSMWQLVNVLAPLIIILIFGVFYYWIRRRRYGS